MKTILMVEDDRDIMRLNRGLFHNAGYEVLEAETVAATVEILRNRIPDLIVLDIMLPDGSGLELCEKLRKNSNEPPILFLSAKNQPSEMVEGLRAGGDDYLPKPYDLDVLLARVEALLRRSGRIAEKLTKGALMLDIMADAASLGGEDMLLTQKEFSVLLLFAQNEGRIISAESLYGKVWKQPMAGDSQSIRTIVSRLRLKLNGSGYDIDSLYKEGYCFHEIT